jgi:hypothetical protein
MLHTLKKLFSSQVLFFHKLTLPTLVHSQKIDLDSRLTLKEISNSILSMQSGKSPGLDGFPVDFFFLNVKDLTPLMLSTFSESYSFGHLPETLNQAFIGLLHKKGKDPLCCQSYRPISLLNLDCDMWSPTRFDLRTLFIQHLHAPTRANHAR